MSQKEYVLSAQGVGFSYPKSDTKALNDVSLKLEHGKIIGLIGSNGAGKTTFIHLLAGVLKPDEGSIYTNYKRLGWCSQRLMIDWFVSVYDNVWMGARLANKRGKQAHEATKTALAALALDSLDLNATPECLSGGQQQRLMIARIFAMDPDFLLLDEPTVGLDVSSIDVLNQHLKALKQQGATMLISSHDFSAIADIVDELIFIEKGQVYFQGPVSKFMELAASTELISITLTEPLSSGELKSKLSALALPDSLVFSDEDRCFEYAQPRNQSLSELFSLLEAYGYTIQDLSRSAQTLSEALKSAAMKGKSFAKLDS